MSIVKLFISHYINIPHHQQFAIRIMAGNPSLSLPPPILNCLLYMAGLLPDDPIFNPLQHHTPHCREFRDCLLDWWEFEEYIYLKSFQYSLSDFESAMKHFMQTVICLFLFCLHVINPYISYILLLMELPQNRIFGILTLSGR